MIDSLRFPDIYNGKRDSDNVTLGDIVVNDDSPNEVSDDEYYFYRNNYYQNQLSPSSKGSSHRVPSLPIPFYISHKRRQLAKERHRRIRTEEYQTILDRFEFRESIRNSILSKAKQQEMERNQARTSIWLKVLYSVAPVYTFNDAARRVIAMRTLRKLVIPIFLKKIYHKKIIAERIALTKKKLSEMVRPDPFTLSQQTFFKHLDHKILTHLAEALTPIAFYKGEYIMRQGDWGQNMYIVDSGEVQVVAKSINSTSKARTKANGELIAVLKRGDYFGEFALLYAEPRMATLFCNTDVTCWELTKDAFLHEVDSRKTGDLPNVLRSMAVARRRENMARLSTLSISQISQLPLFSSWTHNLLDQMLGRLTPYVAHTGDVVIRKGELGDSMYIIGRGLVFVESDNENCAEKKVELGVGNSFGELSCVFNEPRCATVTCLNNCDLWKLSKADLKDLLLTDPTCHLETRRNLNDWRSKWILRPPSNVVMESEALKTIYGGKLKRMTQELFIMAMIPKVYAKYDILLRRGEHLGGILYISNGILALGTNTKFKAGSWIDYEASDTNYQWQDTLQAITKVETWMMERSEFQNFLRRVPPDIKASKTEKPNQLFANHNNSSHNLSSSIRSR